MNQIYQSKHAHKISDVNFGDKRLPAVAVWEKYTPLINRSLTLDQWLAQGEGYCSPTNGEEKNVYRHLREKNDHRNIQELTLGELMDDPTEGAVISRHFAHSLYWRDTGEFEYLPSEKELANLKNPTIRKSRRE